MFMCPSRFIVYDHMNEEMYIISMDTNADRAQQLSFELNEKVVSFQKNYERGDTVNNTSYSIILTSDKTIKEYKENIESCLESIRNGDTYEVCLTLQFQGKTNSKHSSYEMYKKLRHGNAAPFASFIQFSNSETNSTVSILCSSPERFLKINPEGKPHLSSHQCITLCNNTEI